MSTDMKVAECHKARKHPIPFNCKQGAGHTGACSLYTLPPQGRPEMTTDMGATTEHPRYVLHEMTSKPFDGTAYRVRIDIKLEVYVWHGEQWNRSGRLDSTPHQDALQLVADHFAGVLVKQRRIERRWRGEITPERIDADFDAAIALNGGE